MSIPSHTINIYQKPKFGNEQLARYAIFNYKQSINAIGWYDAASLSIALRSESEGQTFLDRYLANRVAIFIDNSFIPSWEGYINRIVVNTGTVEWSISLDEMANRVVVQYAVVAAPAVTAIQNDTNSQALFGIKGETVDIGFQRTVNTPTFNALRDNILLQRAWPQASAIPSSAPPGIRLELRGFYHTLEWESYRDALTGNATLNNMIDTIILPSLANGATFFDNADFTEVGANTLLIDREKLRGMTAWEALQEVQEFGDATDYFVIGITPTLFQTGNRRLYYRPLNSEIEYTARFRDSLRIRSKYGKPIDPWRVVPDRGVKITDSLVGRTSGGDNPTETYMKSVTYDMNTQTAVWQGDDDRTAEGVFNHRRYQKTVGKRFGAVRRLV